tara:strand:- start:2736 stop:3422 length:687 start_codon:yes stop_codon:yes gene_type:complete
VYGSLYIVSTPIGNLDDITCRAIQVLNQVNVIAVEDTRVTKRLLSKYDIKNQMLVYNNFNESKSSKKLIHLLKNGNDVALVSDAGTPCISDPGYSLVNEARKENLNIFSVPGPCALVAALSTSGLPSDSFYFEGFLPKKKGRQTKFKFLANLECSIVIYESPNRIIKTLNDIKLFFGDERIVSVQREITKIYEQAFIGNISEVLKKFIDKKNKGEFVIIIAKESFKYE